MNQETHSQQQSHKTRDEHAVVDSPADVPTLAVGGRSASSTKTQPHPPGEENDVTWKEGWVTKQTGDISATNKLLLFKIHIW